MVDLERIADKPSESASSVAPVVEAALNDHYHEFRRYLVRRVKNTAIAEDVLQTFCMRVITSKAVLRNKESVVAWLYTVLRSVLIDHYRREATRQRREYLYTRDQIALDENSADTEYEENDCSCLHELVPTLRTDYAEVLQRIDLSGEPREQVAADLGITPPNVRVRLHRARQALARSLGNFCGSCCKDGFHDCNC